MTVVALTPQQQVNVITRAANRHGISPAVLWGLYGVETGYGHNVRTSSAGAVGPFQFMPGTAKSLGINPYNFRQAANGAAKYLATYKGRGVRGMLAAYNAGPAADPSVAGAYPSNVLKAARTFPGRGGVGALGQPGGGGGGSQTLDLGGGVDTSMPASSSGALALLQQLTAKPQMPASAGLAPPAASAAPVMAKGAQLPAAGGGPAPKPDVSALLAAIRTVGGDVPGGASGGQGATLTGSAGVPQGSGRGGRLGTVTFDGKPVRSDFAQELAWARSHGWKGTVTSGFRTKSQQIAAANNYGLQHYGPQGPLGSNHVVGHQGAVDVTDPEQLNKILGRYPGKRTLIWGGPVIGDRPHFSPTGH